MNFNQLLIDTAAAFLGDELEAEQVEYVKSSQAGPAGQPAATMATAGVLSGSIAIAAVDGVLEPAEVVETTRTIDAIVQREGLDGIGDAPRGRSSVFIVSVANDSELGISSAEINVGGDVLKLAVRVGQAIQTRRISKILSHDAGMLQLECR